MEKKTGEIIVPTEPTNPPAKITGFTFKSYDKKAGVLQFEIKNQDGSPTDLINATVRLFMYIYSGEEKKEFPIFDNQIITESYMQGIVKYFIPDMLLAYEGKVDANVYIDFPDGSHTDNLAFTFNIEKSIIDRDVQLNGEYYFKDFQQLLDGIKQETTDAVNEALTNVDSTIEKANQQINNFVEDAAQSIDQTIVEVTEELKTTQSNIDTVSQNVVSTQNELTLIKDKMNQTNQQIGDLGKLKKMYSNSIDFGDYDYSGNPNLLSTITSDYFTTKDNVTITNENRGVKLTFRNSGFGAETGNVMQIKPQTTYTLSAKVTVNEDFVGDLSKVRLTYRKFPGGNILLGTNLADTLVGETKMISVTGSVSEMKQVERTYLRLDSNSQIVDGSISIEYIKLEEGAIPTPYHPNLFEKPWQISKIPLNENLANQSVVFPINTSTYNLYAAKMKKNLEIGKTMTITLKGTKPVNQSFKLFGNGSIDYGTLTPVNGLVDTWRLTFTPNEVAAANPSNIELYQVPKNTLGNCTIEWLKIEEGDVATPNISEYKYRGIGMRDSDNPEEYVWDLSPKYVENNLATDTKISEIVSQANKYTDGKASEINSQLTASINEVDKKVTANTSKIATNTTNIKTISDAMPLFAIYSEGRDLTDSPDGTKIPIGTLVATDFFHTASDLPYTISSDGITLTATRNCVLFFEGSVKLHGNNTFKFAYVKIRKNGSDTNFANVGSSANLNYMTSQAGQYVHTLVAGDKVEFTLGIDAAAKMFHLQLLSLKISEVNPA
ncbi:BppU family phage baseplate upper protein [Enterococcus hirae]|nr:BppU family phage baseplate upper protein [Enterococcus hirae]EMF0139807.1 BppU family phage baseplate upper protein [Enterococcus hirae]